MRITLSGLVLFCAFSAHASQWEIVEERQDGDYVRLCCQVDSAEINVRQYRGSGMGSRCTSCGQAPAMCAVSAACAEMGTSTVCPPTDHDEGEGMLPMTNVAVCGRNVCRFAETAANKTLLQRCATEMRTENLQIPAFRDSDYRVPSGAGAAH